MSAADGKTHAEKVEEAETAADAEETMSAEKAEEMMQTGETEQAEKDGPVIIKTDAGNKDGQNKCPSCGSTDVTTNPKAGKLRCNFCRHEFSAEVLAGMNDDPAQLSGVTIGSGATDIVPGADEVLTFKCASCGAEVVIDTASAPAARCHWCRNTLSINQQIPNGAIPDAILPFKLDKKEAMTHIEKFVNTRKTFAHPKFRAEFSTENIMGVYFPYMVIDANVHAKLSGEGEITKRIYYKGSDENRKKYYDADRYRVQREYNAAIGGLSVESNSDKLTRSKANTNNVINAIMPFDVENCTKYNSHYLTGYTSERRDTNIDNLRPLVAAQIQDIAKFAVNDSLQQYDRGVCWSDKKIKVKGERWLAAYLPVWLYSYQQEKGEKKLLHYVAVNARTQEVMGSVPIYYPKLLLFSALAEVCSIFSWLGIFNRFIDSDLFFLFFLPGPIYFAYIYFRYRNTNARHSYERETKTTVSDLEKVDEFIETKTGLTESKMEGANNTRIEGSNSL